MNNTTTYKSLVVGYLLIVTALTGCVSSTGGFAVQSQTAVAMEIIGYNGLSEAIIFKGQIDKHQIITPYRGLALLSFSGGQCYPVVLGEEPFTLNISDPSQIPTFTGSTENDILYKSLSGNDSVPEQYDFVNLMIQAKALLESTHSIKAVAELTAKKQEYHEFVSKHYENLRHSDMVRRLIAQYFMMHEYVDYHIPGEPATEINVKYQKEVLNGVGSWLDILKSHIPEHEVLNYCVSLYYNRSMVTMASLIIENFRDAAYCPGAEKKTFSFPADILISEADGNKERKLDDFKGNTIIAFVSDNCPVSMVEAISKVRQLATQKKDSSVIVAPMQKLSWSHLAMRRMISSGNLFFINDEKWRKDTLEKKIRLPLFVRVGDDVE
jgi:hypothetical protein